MNSSRLMLSPCFSPADLMKLTIRSSFTAVSGRPLRSKICFRKQSISSKFKRLSLSTSNLSKSSVKSRRSYLLSLFLVESDRRILLDVDCLFGGEDVECEMVAILLNDIYFFEAHCPICVSRIYYKKAVNKRLYSKYFDQSLWESLKD
jgi:hypothetical protein